MKFKLLVFVLFLGGCGWGCQAKEKDIVAHVFNDGDFVPHVLTEEQVVKSYGPGLVKRTGYEIERTYRSTACDRWLAFLIDPDASPEYRIVREIRIVSARSTKDKPSYRGDICSLKLSEIAIGDDKLKIFS